MLSQHWITLHIWSPERTTKLLPTEKIFVSPLYNPFLIDQSLVLNRRLEENEIINEKSDEIEEPAEDLCLIDNDSKGSSVGSSGQAPRVMACVTMWHETEEEMLEMLRSIVRMDEDQSARRLAKRYLKAGDPDYYDFESKYK